MRLPAMSRRTWIALAVAVIGIAVIAAVFLSGSDDSSTDDRAGEGSDLPSGIQKNLTPLPPGGSADPGASTGKKIFDGKGNPFGASYGGSASHKVTVRITGNGYMAFGVRYRDKKGSDFRYVNGSYSVTRTIVGAYPLVQAAIELAPNANRGSCQILIDGISTVTATANKPFGFAVCTN